jgi:molecular chaperone GrpE
MDEPVKLDDAALAEEYLAGWKRAMADYDNLKKESERMRADLGKYAAAGLISQLLPSLDAMKKAFSQQPAEPAAWQNWANGMSAVRQQIETVLKGAGVTAIEEAGVKFDPAVHEAMLQEKAEKAEPGTVLKVLEPGYKMHDRVLRPAKVVVAE